MTHSEFKKLLELVERHLDSFERHDLISGGLPIYHYTADLGKEIRSKFIPDDEPDVVTKDEWDRTANRYCQGMTCEEYDAFIAYIRTHFKGRRIG